MAECLCILLSRELLVFTAYKVNTILYIFQHHKQNGVDKDGNAIFKQIALADFVVGDRGNARVQHTKGNGLWFEDEGTISQYSIAQIISSYEANPDVQIRTELIDLDKKQKTTQPNQMHMGASKHWRMLYLTSRGQYTGLATRRKEPEGRAGPQLHDVHETDARPFYTLS